MDFKKLRVFLIPLGALTELVLLVTCYLLALVSLKETSRRLTDWSLEQLPSREW